MANLLDLFKEVLGEDQVNDIMKDSAIKNTPTEQLLSNLYTSSFFNKETSKLPNNYSISRSQPKGFNYPELSILAPSKDLLYNYKYNGLSWDDYIREYTNYLDTNKEKVLNIISSLENNAILNCWEGSNNPKCHRHLLADWLTKNSDYTISEYDLNKK